MSIQSPTGPVLLIELSDDPQLNEALATLLDQVIAPGTQVVLDLSAVRYVNSSNLSRLLRLRKRLIVEELTLLLRGMSPQVRGVFTATGLDMVFMIQQ